MDRGIDPIRLPRSSWEKKVVPNRRPASRCTGEGSELCEEIAGASKGLSAFWRMNSSPVASTELANLLRALRKAAGYLGPNVGHIEWAGMSRGDTGAIVLDPSLVSGRYPVPSEKVDYVLGLLVHEAVLRIEWTDLVWKNLEPYLEEMRILHKIMFQKIVETGEHIYCDMVLDRCLLGLYAARARRVAMKKARLRLPRQKVTVDELVHRWWEITWDHGTSEGLDAYAGALEPLDLLSRQLREMSTSSARLDRRCEQRSSLYIDAWEQARAAVIRLDVVNKILVWHPESGVVGCGRRTRESTQGMGTKLPSGVARKVEAELARTSTDLTPIIRSIVGYENRDVVPMSRWDFNISARPVVDTKQVGRLQAIFRSYAERSKLVSRGLTSGKIDRKRLYRAPISGRCFMEAHHIPNMNWNMCLLVDASGSMRGPKWRLVENTVATIHRAFLGFENSFRAWAYFEANGISMMANLVRGRSLLSIPPSGQTTSGQAIIAAAYLMPHDGRRSLLVHVTDGESNFGCDVQYGIDFCRDKGIHLVTLGCGYSDRTAMLRQYGRAIQFLNSFSQLPSALEKLLKWTLLYGGNNHATAQGNWALGQLVSQGGATL